MDPDPTKP
jgi:hypothetical protein